MRNFLVVIALFVLTAPALAQNGRSIGDLANPPSPASWTFNSGDDLWALCNTIDTKTGLGRAYRGFCMGYIKGVADVLEYQQRIHTPRGLTNGQLYDTVMAWLSKHPEQRHLAALDVIYLALHERFQGQ